MKRLKVIVVLVLLYLPSTICMGQLLQWSKVATIPDADPGWIIDMSIDHDGTLYGLKSNRLDVFKSTDNGDSFSRMASPADAFPDPWGKTLAGVFADSGLVLASTDFGIYRSTDGGGTWSLTTGTPETFRYEKFIKTASGEIFAIGHGLYRSSDRGLTWTANPLEPSSVHEIVQFDNGYFLAAGNSNFYRSTDNGVMWIPIDPFTGFSGNTRALGVLSDQTVFAALSMGVWRSTDFGLTWSVTGTGLWGQFYGCETSPSGHVFASGDSYNGRAGVFSSSDLGATWNSENAGLGADTSDIHLLFGSPNGYFFRFGAHGEVYRTRVPVLPEAIAPLFPPDKAEVIGDSVVISWESGEPEVNRYLIEHSSDSLFGSKSSDSGVVNSTYVVRGLVSGTTYWWRVKAHNAAGWGPFSEVRSFTTLRAPYAVVLGGPASGSAVPSENAMVWWQRSEPSVVTYQCEIATDSMFNGKMTDSLVVDTTLVLDQLPSGTYWWRVRGYNPAGWGAYSEIWSFTAMRAPKAVVLGGPASGFAVQGESALVWWQRSEPSVTGYQFEIATDSAFSFKRSDSLVIDTSCVVGQLSSGTYWWRVRACNPLGWGPFSDVWSFTVNVTGLDETGELPKQFSLDQNYPNPFNPSTTLRFALPERVYVLLKVFNSIGQEVATLVQGEKDAGYHELVFDASDLSSGVYLYRLTAGSFVETRKLLYLR